MSLLWIPIAVIGFLLLFGYLGMFKAFTEVAHSFRRLNESIRISRTLRKESPEADEIVRKMLESEEGKFVINLGILTENELAGLTKVQLGKWLRDVFAILLLCSKQGFIETIPTLRKDALKRFKL